MKWSSVKSYKAKIGFLASVFLVIILMAVLIPACAAPAEEVTLTLVSGWPEGVAFNDMVEVWVDRVNEEGEGKVFIDFLGGPEVAAITEQVGLVRDGVYDMTKSTPGYYGGLCPAAVPLYYAAPFDPVKMREIGITALADEFHREAMGVTLLGFTTRGEHFTIVSKEPITSADFSGILMHTIPIFTAALTYLGASTTTLQVPDFYVALQTGVVDAIPCPTATVPYDYKLYEVAKYILYPPIPITTTGMILINEARWEGLPEDVKQLLTDKMIETEAEVIEHFETATDAVVEKLVTEGGMEIIELPPAEAEKYYYAFTDYAWEKFSERNPVWGPKLYELSKPYLEY